MGTFTTPNMNDLRQTCSKIISLVTCKAILYLAIAYAIVKWTQAGFPGLTNNFPW